MISGLKVRARLVAWVPADAVMRTTKFLGATLPGNALLIATVMLVLLCTVTLAMPVAALAASHVADPSRDTSVRPGTNPVPEMTRLLVAPDAALGTTSTADVLAGLAPFMLLMLGGPVNSGWLAAGLMAADSWPATRTRRSRAALLSVMAVVFTVSVLPLSTTSAAGRKEAPPSRLTSAPGSRLVAVMVKEVVLPGSTRNTAWAEATEMPSMAVTAGGAAQTGGQQQRHHQTPDTQWIGNTERENKHPAPMGPCP